MGKQTKKKSGESQMLESKAARRRREEARKKLSDVERGEGRKPERKPRMGTQTESPIAKASVPLEPSVVGGGQLVSPEQQSMEEAMMEERVAAQIKARKEARDKLNKEVAGAREQDAVDQVVRDRSENEARRRRLMEMAENYSRLQFEGGPSKVQ
jgi:hypothetical protein|tara:strand:+ start:659 stop:1123 length:465 start_codon:yes stop_codon:yes gene_type:complete